MAKMTLTPKRMQINQANVVIVASISVAAFITIFSLVASRALLSQRSYQSRVISKQETAKKQLDSNIKAASTLEASYKQFVGQPENIIGGSSAGAGDRDGDNAKIVLDALPSKYDYPAVATTIEKLVSSKNGKFVSITGADDEVTQLSSAGGGGAAVDMPIEFVVEAGYNNMRDLIDAFEKSIRPFSFDQITLTASKDDVLNMDAKIRTQYLPEKTLSVKSEVVQ